ncbi:MAG: tRNA lysidine(34) synthetase TilS [Lachnospiraceae bacterium]|nr:tRNA lysidine(34) synthetase TilS [Lachnospiraceae bacterium]
MQKRKQLEDRIREFIVRQDMIRPGERVLIGLSGGADSRCLFEVLTALAEEMTFSVSVVHVDHGLRAASGADAEAVSALCAARGVPCDVRVIENPERMLAAGVSVEEEARRLRYEAFAKAFHGFRADRLALAHNRDDQAETVLMKLFRGAGLKGLSGMQPVTILPGLGDGKPMCVIRPLLSVPRPDIEAYLTSCGITWRTDESNEGDLYARNRVRHHILPYAEEKLYRGAGAHTAQAADRIREALAFIEGEAKTRGERICRSLPDGGCRIDLPLLWDEPPFMQKEILLAQLRTAGLRSGLTERHMEALCALAASGSGSQTLDLPGGICAERVYNTLTVRTGRPETAGVTHPAKESSSANARIDWRVVPRGAEHAEIPVDPFTKWFDFDTIKQSVCIRTRRPGDWIDVGCGRKRLKKELIDRRIPSGERDVLPLLAAGDEILWIGGIRRCDSHRVTADTSRVLEAHLVR